MMNENNSVNPALVNHQKIMDLLPRYYETHGDDPKYQILRSMVIDGHEVAWMQYDGVVKYDILGNGREGEAYTGRELFCACDFTEDVGWRWDEKMGVIGIGNTNKCIFKKTAVHLRHLELRLEYQERKMLDPFDFDAQHQIEKIMLDMMEKGKAGEFLEGSGGAASWGGYYYFQTVAQITNFPMADIWKALDKLIADKKISLEGAVVQAYHKPPAPKWDTYQTYELNGWKGEIKIPTHSQMPLEWRFEVTDPKGKTVKIKNSKLAMMYAPTFGPDSGDVNQAQKIIEELVTTASEASFEIS